MTVETKALMESISKLFTARWNIPQASRNAGITDDEMKVIFACHCKTHPITYTNEQKES